MIDRKLVVVVPHGTHQGVYVSGVSLVKCLGSRVKSSNAK